MRFSSRFVLASALGLLATASRAQAPADPCADLAKDYAALAKSPGKPCAPFPNDSACDEARRWAALQDAYIRHFAARGDDESRETAEFLRRHPDFLLSGNDQVDDSPKIWDGTFRSDLNKIVLDEKRLAPFWASVPSTGDVAAAAEPFVDGVAAIMVHEVTHALEAEEAGGAEPDNVESELLAYSRQARYLRARLAEDPSFENMDVLEQGLARVTGSTAPAGGWWRRPLAYADVAGIKPSVVAVREGSNGLVTYDTTNDWFLIRSFAAGPVNFEVALSSTDELGDKGRLSELDDKGRLERADTIAGQIADDVRCRKSSPAYLREFFRLDERGLGFKERVLRSRRRLDKLKRYYARALAGVAIKP